MNFDSSKYIIRKKFKTEWIQFIWRIYENLFWCLKEMYQCDVSIKHTEHFFHRKIVKTIFLWVINYLMINSLY